MNNNGVDTLLVSSAVSAPLWMQELNLIAGICFATIGSVIGLFRLYYMIKDRQKDAGKTK